MYFGFGCGVAGKVPVNLRVQFACADWTFVLFGSAASSTVPWLPCEQKTFDPRIDPAIGYIIAAKQHVETVESIAVSVMVSHFATRTICSDVAYHTALLSFQQNVQGRASDAQSSSYRQASMPTFSRFPGVYIERYT